MLKCYMQYLCNSSCKWVTELERRASAPGLLSLAERCYVPFISHLLHNRQPSLVIAVLSKYCLSFSSYFPSLFDFSFYSFHLIFLVWLIPCTPLPLFLSPLVITIWSVPLTDLSWAFIDQPLTGTTASSLLKEQLRCLSLIDRGSCFCDAEKGTLLSLRWFIESDKKRTADFLMPF